MLTRIFLSVALVLGISLIAPSKASAQFVTQSFQSFQQQTTGLGGQVLIPQGCSQVNPLFVGNGGFGYGGVGFGGNVNPLFIGNGGFSPFFGGRAFFGGRGFGGRNAFAGGRGFGGGRGRRR